MPTKKQESPGQTWPLKLTAAERRWILHELLCLDSGIEQAIHNAPARQPVLLSGEDLDDLAGNIAAVENHARNRSQQQKLDAIYEKVLALLDEASEAELPATVKFDPVAIADPQVAANAPTEESIIAQAVEIMSAVATLPRRAQAMIDDTVLFVNPKQRETLSRIPGISSALKRKLAQPTGTFPLPEIVLMMEKMSLASQDDIPDGLVVMSELAQQIHDEIRRLAETHGASAAPLKSGGKGAGKSKTKATSHTATSTVMQFKITLKGIQPPIWRRIQVEDCTLHDLHSHIQDAMGWTNSHMHQFMIQGLSYSPPNPFANGEWDIDSENSAGIMLSDIVPATGKRFRFQYEYDFGDSWNHEILFEGFRTKDPAVRYPQCLDGARACPPEDCGGVWGYMGLLSALDDPKHARHDDMSEWVGPIDPEEFDAETVTAIMQNGD